MIQKITRLGIALVFLFVFAPFQKANATHINGSDISYRCLGGDTYQIVVKVYRDCSGVAVPSSISVDVSSTCATTSVSCAMDVSLNSPPGSSTGQEVSQLCPGSLALSTCSGGTLPGVQVYTYVGTVVVTPGCGLYTFNYNDCCRNTSNNLLDPFAPSLGFGVQATLNSSLVSCDDAPTFSSLPVPYFCLNQGVNYSHGAADPDGDSLVYSLIVPSDGTNPLTYQGTYSATNPLPTNGGFGFDPQSGQMTFVPTSQGVYVVDVLVSEYRNGVLIGTTMRDIQIIIIPCNNSAPQVSNSLSMFNVTGGVVLDNNSLGVCPGTNISFAIGARDPDGQAITVSSNIATSIPGATLTTTTVGGTDSVRVVFSWTPSGLDTGFRYFTVQFEDNACPITGLQLFTYDISVLTGTYAGPDKNYCPAGGPVQVNVYGGNHFSWTPTSGIVTANPDSSKLTIAPLVTTDYIVHSDLMGGCKTLDTVTVFVVPDITSTITSPDDTICLNSSTTLLVTTGPSGQAPFVYSWGPAIGGVISPSSANTEVRPLTTTNYTVTITSSAGCIIKDTFRVVIEGIGPKVNILTTGNYLCPGTPVVLTASVSALSCGPVADPQNPCLPNSNYVLQDLGTGTANGNFGITPYAGAYADARSQFIYRASELQAFGLTAGTITDLAFNVILHGSTSPYNNFSIKMGCTSLSQLTTTFVGGLNTVLAPQPYTAAAGWNTHTLDTAFNWDGFSNLIVEVCYDNTISNSGYDAVYYTTTPTLNSTLWRAQSLSTSSGCTSFITGTVAQNRPNTRFVMCQAPVDNFSFVWNGSDGSQLPDTSTVTFPLNHDVVYSLTVTDGICSGDTSISMFVDSSVLINAGNDTVICNSQSVQLHAALSTPTIPYCIAGYNIGIIPYSAITPAGNVIAGPSGDDVVSNALLLPFPFKVFCSSTTAISSTFYISTNGFISFSANQGSGCCSGQNLPNTGTPNNVIALAWEDLNTGAGGSIDYFVSGNAPNRIGVIRWNGVSYYGGGGNITGQIQLYENGNVVEIHVFSQNNPGQTNTLGIEDATGTAAAVPPGFNSSAWVVSSPIAFRFTPQSGGNTVSSWQWSPNYNVDNDSAATTIVSPDTSVNYVVTANFASGCVTTDTVRIDIGNFPYTLVGTPDSICAGDTAHLVFTGNGSTYNWTPAASLSSATVSSPYASPSATTTYRVIATDSLGCGITDTVVVHVKTHLPITLGSDTIICPADSLILSPSGGPYISYLWSRGDTVSTISTGVQAQNTQNYFVRINDGTCFYNSDTIIVSKRVLSQIVVQPSGDTAVCVGDSIHISGDPGYQSYLWSSGDTTQLLTINTAGNYSYIAIDSNGCVLQSQDTAFVLSLQHPSALINTTADTICIGQTTAILSATADSSIVHIWNPGNVIADTLVVSNAGTYYLLANNKGCSSNDSVIISAVQPPVLDLGADQNLCACDTVVSLTSDVVGNHYAWSTSDSTRSIAVRQQGTYSLTVTDLNGCSANDVVTLAFHCLTVDATVADPATATVFAGRNAVLDANTADYSSTFTYLWTPPVSLQDSTNEQAHVQQAQTTTTYWVKVTDQINGCVAYDSTILTVVPPGVPPMPNAFSPNGDGLNDTYGPAIPQGLQGVYTIVQMRIYNRWGQLVFNTNTPWDGNFNGTPQPADTYVYYITMSGPDQHDPNLTTQYTLTGSFTLLH